MSIVENVQYESRRLILSTFNFKCFYKRCPLLSQQSQRIMQSPVRSFVHRITKREADGFDEIFLLSWWWAYLK